VRRSGESRLRAAIQRWRTVRKAAGAEGARAPRPRRADPCPYDESWGWWVDRRLRRVEGQLKWLLALALTTLGGEVLRILVETLGLGQP